MGDNTGLFGLFLNQSCRRATVYAFEPVPAIFAVLRRNVERHDHLGIRFFNLGVAREAGQATFTYYTRAPSASTMFPYDLPKGVAAGQPFVLDQFNKAPWPIRWPLALCPGPLKRFLANRICMYHLKSESVACSLTTLSAVIEEHRLEQIHLLKGDAEGSEDRILSGNS